MTRARRPAALVALTPGTARAADVPALLSAAREAVEAGLAAVLLREPALSDGELLGVARELRARLDPHRSWLGVHDRVHVALAAGADAVHLGFRSLPPSEARRASGPELALGLSTHAGDDEASWSGADYLFHGPVRATPSKHGLVDPVGFDGLAAGVRRAAAPVWALGGLRPEDVGAVLAAGAAGLAVLSGVFGDARPGASAGRYLEALADARHDDDREVSA